MKPEMRYVLTALMIVSLGMSLMGVSAASPYTAVGVKPVSEICRLRLDDGRPTWSVSETKHAIRCAFDRFAPAQLDHALDIAYRESRYHADARNPSEPSACRWEDPYGSCGAFQHLMRYWGERVLTFGRAAWFSRTWPHVPILNARANAIVTARMVAAGGWGPWGG
jgi:hypothetical protein